MTSNDNRPLQSVFGSLVDEERAHAEDDDHLAPIMAEYDRLERERSELQKRALEGDVGAQALLGRIYFDGLGVPQDEREAVKWLRAAADQGDACSQNTLGVMFQ